ncbi:MAG: Gfo/Idh/MocA family protein [Candidatus Nanopelagicales bacterium]
MTRLRLVGIGCGARTRGYLRTAALFPELYQVVAGADPVPERVAEVASLATGEFAGFASAAELLAQPRLGDVAVIGTQDAYHLEPALAALRAGYDLLLEKPIAQDAASVLELARQAEALGRKVAVCHILRYTGLNEAIHRILAGGELGEVITIDAREGLGVFHQAHSYVRGHWGNTARATPMIVAKSCHDTDLISWFAGSLASLVSSFGSLSWFTAANAPAGAPMRCTDGCPVGEQCRFNALRYLDSEAGWLALVMDGAATASEEARREFLRTSPWGRCVYRCDNDAVDHQVVTIEFTSGATATLTMTGFDNDDRLMTICGTLGKLVAGDRHKRDTGAWITVTSHDGQVRRYGEEAGEEFAGHAGGDYGIIASLAGELAKPAEEIRTGLPASLQSHLIAFAAEESRLTGRTIDVAEFAAAPPGRG